MLAIIGGMPKNTNTGRVIKLPPPARALRLPAKNAAMQTIKTLRIGSKTDKELNLYTPSTITTNLLEETRACFKATLYSSEL